ncbi:hypothetical protein PH235_12630 [Trichococcus sp. K1Tr]|uniref:hypothetical protein n=1 Tax=Trichococcus sp. K1Tr TaxID=3020847 RepID=UPI00232CD6CD|nr:hypothetical protein [Trichococcus sp. K1Tr]MDB6354407.1 hypothetical protein [Trichococcus sp. K1Tr]
MEKNDQQHFLVNMDKKKIKEPARLTWAGDSTITGMAATHPQSVVLRFFQETLLRR